MSFADIFEIIPLRLDTIENISSRTVFTSEELMETLKKANATNTIIFYTLVRVDKLN